METNIFKDKLNTYWRNIDKKILFSFIILFLLGLFFSFSSTSSLAGERLNKDYYFFFSKHLIFAIFALFLMFFISILDLNYLKKTIIPIFIILLIALILVPLIGVEVKGSKRWLSLYFFRLQPVEILKPFFVLITANILTLDRNKTSKYSYIISFILLLSVILLLINQPDIGQSILIVATWIAMIFISGISLIYILSFFGFSLAFLSGLIVTFPEKFGYISNRLNVFLDPTKGDSFQSQKALDAIKQGGLKGEGMGEGVLKDSVPEAHTDYIIAVISEEFGAIFVLFIVTVFLYIGYKSLNKVFFSKDEFIKLALVGLVSLLIIQTFIHIGVNIRLLPTTGMTLPFLSYGGSSLVGSSIIAGVILNFTRKDFTREIKND
jgi:cell division protein FtsW